MANPIDDRLKSRQRQQWKQFKTLGLVFIKCNFCGWTSQQKTLDEYPVTCPGCKAVKPDEYESIDH